MILKSTLGFSQKDSSGIYFSANDYLKHKLSFAINCKTQKHKIKDEMLLHPKIISIKHNDTIYKFPKDSVYGIRYCDGSIVRIYSNSEYQLINPNEEILIYKTVVTKNEGRAGTTIITDYFFSKNAQSKIQELTVYNIKAAFPDNHKFHDLIDMEFHSNDELMAYDQIHKMRKINRVLLISIGK